MVMSLEVQLRPEWFALTDTLGVTHAVSQPVLADLCRRYSESSRFYHTLVHVGQMFRTMESWRRTVEVQDWRSVRLAVWFHDAVYDSRAADTEEQSARFAHEVLTAWGAADEMRAAVERLILATETHTLGDDDQDGALMLDADLAILGSTPAEYDRYRRAIRKEYAWVPEDAYRAGRGRVLQGFLDRPRIYRTPMAFEAWEHCARRNICGEIERLQG
jgi:predicted metal-dependent HD superfamily phosphohydrolase